jgi:hypothetical protein
VGWVQGRSGPWVWGIAGSGVEQKCKEISAKPVLRKYSFNLYKIVLGVYKYLKCILNLV